MSTALNSSSATARQQDGSPAVIPTSAGSFSDALGDRKLAYDAGASTPVEILEFKHEFSHASGFESALRTRIEQLSRVRHPSLAVVRGVTRPPTGESLSLVSMHVAGRRLSEIVSAARGASFGIELIQQLAPALAALHQQGHGISHGALNTDRIIVTREGRLVITEPVVGLAIESLRLPVSRLRSEFKLAMPQVVDATLDARGDVVQLGFVALSLLLGRALDSSVFPARIPALLDEFATMDAAASARLRRWLERAMQIGDRPFANAREAHTAFQNGGEQLTPPAREVPRGVVPFPTPTSMPVPTLANAPTPAMPQHVPLFDVPVEAQVAAAPVWANRVKIGLRWAVGVLAVGVVVEAVMFSGILTRPAATAVTPTPVARPVPPPPNPAAVRPTPPAHSPAPPVDPSAAAKPALDPAAAVTTGGTEVRIDPPAGGTTTPVAPPAPPPAPPARLGTLSISCPIEVQVMENGVSAGSSSGPVSLAEGQHTVDFVNEALGFRVTQKITVKVNRTTPLTVAIPNGRVSINALPWAEVTIDGKAIGETPIANLALPIGTHEVLFRHPQLGEQKQSVVVRVEGLTRVSANFQR